MKRKAKIFYTSLDDFWRKEEKLAWLRDNPIEKIQFESITPDEKHNWINQTDNDFETLLPLIDKDVKLGKKEEAIFKIYSTGYLTGRDEWIIDEDKDNLSKKMSEYIKIYNKSSDKNLDTSIKWSRNLQSRKHKGMSEKFNNDSIIETSYRPFINKLIYNSPIFIDESGLAKSYLDLSKSTPFICISGKSSSKSFQILATDNFCSYDYLEKTQCLPLFTSNPTKPDEPNFENITDWGLTQFQNHYKSANGAKITKQDIFYYTYAVLHSPVYRKKYEQNLKREFPRLPFYDDFTKWRDWGKELMDLHVNYETQESFALTRKDEGGRMKDEKKIKKQADLFDANSGSSFIPHPSSFETKPRVRLRADKANGAIEIDSHTTLTGIPHSAWEYKLGNRSALEWILDQYKEKKPQDATIAERFNAYKFADYKEQVIDLLKRVCAVSIRTMEIIEQMPNE